MQVFRQCAFVLGLVAFLSGCTHARLLRPSVLKQLDRDVAQLVNELPNVDKQNEAIIGRLFVHGGLSHAEVGADDVMRDKIRIPAGEFVWKPAIVVMPHSGEIEIEFVNEDDFSHHAAILPSDGDRQLLMSPVHTRGKATLRR